MKSIAVIITQDYEDSELESPLNRLKDEKFKTTIIAPKAGELYKGKQGNFEITADQSLASANPSQFDGLLIPGGASPEQLRLEKGAVDFVRHFVKNRKPIAAICHGPQLLISADGVDGRTMTCYESVRVDLGNAGADVVDREVVVDDNIVTSRKPDDLPAFNQAMIKVFNKQLAGVS